MEIYVEYVIIDNMVIDSLILSLTKFLLKITTQKDNHPLHNSKGHREIYIQGGQLILIYRYDEYQDTLYLQLRLQDAVNHDELSRCDNKKFDNLAEEYDIVKFENKN